MAYRQLTDIDFNKNQALNVVVQVLATPPTNPREGQIYYSSTDDTIYVYNSNGWLDLGYEHPNLTARNVTTSGATVIASFTSNSQGHVTGITTREMTLADLGFTGDPDANNYTHPAYSSANYSRTGALSVISGITISNGHIQSITETDLSGDAIGELVINDGSTTSTRRTWSAKALADKFADLDSTISGALVYKGGYDAATNTPNLDNSPTGIQQGFTYTVTVAGDFFNERVDPGDMIIAEVDNPDSLSDWTVVNKNIEEILYATTSVAGKIELATQAEVNAGNDSTRAVTPSTLHTLLANRVSESTYKTHIGNGSASSFDIVHGLGTRDVMIQVYDDLSSSPHYGKEVGVVKERPSVSKVTIQVNEPLESNELRVLIKAI